MKMRCVSSRGKLGAWKSLLHRLPAGSQGVWCLREAEEGDPGGNMDVEWLLGMSLKQEGKADSSFCAKGWQFKC